MTKENVRKALERMEQGTYRNTNEIVLGGVPFTARDVLVKAPIISRLNAYYVGGTGEGKTQLANDLCGYFSDSSCYAMGRADFEPSEIMKSMNWDLLRKLQAGEKVPEGELEKLSENVNKCFFYVDELNRCPPIVQNYFFDFFDGKLVHQGKIRNLGKEGYSVGFASGNLGDGEYVGTSQSDRALKDRMHLILGIDHPLFSTTSFDDLMIFSGSKKDPRASLPETQEGMTSEIIQANKEFQARPLNPLLPVLGVYLTKGLDYLENPKSHSKKAIKDSWYHSNIEGVREDSDESLIFPMSKRAVLSAQALASAFQFIAEANGQKVANPAELFLDGLKLIVPYSGILHPTYVEQKHSGDVYSAFDEAMTFSREEILKKQGKLEEAVLLAETGAKNPKLLKAISGSEGRWTCVKDAISQYADYRKANPSEEGKALREIIKEAHDLD